MYLTRSPDRLSLSGAIYGGIGQHIQALTPHTVTIYQQVSTHSPLHTPPNLGTDRHADNVRPANPLHPDPAPHQTLDTPPLPPDVLNAVLQPI